VAAYKHVPLLEEHLRVSMFNNIVGTKMVAELAEIYKVRTFVLISTDKAVNPTNVMGATKRAAEVLCQAFNQTSTTRYITVRFGNVLNSAGSVIPLFRKQIAEGGPLTVTHREISRYFMTIPEASRLILQALALKDQGDVFVLDMGEPININYLAEQMIKLSGKLAYKDIDITYTGLRPGEKMHEELFHQDEEVYDTLYPKIKRAKVNFMERSAVLQILKMIERACEMADEDELRALLLKLVPEYQPLQKPQIANFSDSKQNALTLNYV
jgi:FlaA1/EpsC-like NDP-sugar epimerase